MKPPHFVAPPTDADDRERFTLSCDETITLRRRESVSVRCEAGMLWLTIEGDGNDYFLRGGESIACAKNRAIVIEARHAAARFATVRG